MFSAEAFILLLIDPPAEAGGNGLKIIFTKILVGR